MFRKALRFVVLVILAFGAGVTPARATQFVLNGSLEDLNSDWVNTSDNYMALAAGSPAIADWIAAGTGDIAWGKSPTSDGHNAANGTYFVDLTGFGAGDPNGAIQQMLTGLVVGQTYMYSMDVEGTSIVFVGGGFVALTPGAPFVVGTDVWTPETGTFVAGAANEL